MIDVEIRGPIAEKEYNKLRKLLHSGGEALQELSVQRTKILVANYGGAQFVLYEPDENHYYYTAKIVAAGPNDAQTAQKDLETLARKFKLPMWSPIDMLEFLRTLPKQ